MFRVPTYVSRSSIHGLGVFAAARIARGTTIWEFDPAADWALTEAEMAVALGCAPGTVKSRLSRALGRLRERLTACTEERTVDDARREEIHG